MTDRSVAHDTFVIERRYEASPARVFTAWSDPAAKAKWFGEPDFGAEFPHEMDFRVGGHEKIGGRPPGGSLYTYDAVYQDIVEAQRIVYTYEMQMDGKRISVSVATIEFAADGDGTRLIVTEQGAYLDGYDTSAQREQGTKELLEALAKSLDEG